MAKKKQKKPAAMIGTALLALVTLGGATFDQKINEDKRSCGGKERWAVKTLIDYNRKKVDVDHPVKSSISHLTSLKTFDAMKAATRQPMEMKVYTVECEIKEKIPEDDKD